MPAVNVLTGEIQDGFGSIKRARPFADMLAVPLQIRSPTAEHERFVTFRSQRGNERAPDETAAARENDAFHSGWRLRAAQP